ncbi:MAG: ABC transporter ATP-binding protein/permease [Candidatus Gracilibacteria bacterium]|nr:ABC transporter ATP-binding protein/permease [Candidatus Gracilibacteria bacterium]
MLKSFIFALHLAWENSKNNRLQVFLMFIASISNGIALFFAPYFLSKFVTYLSEHNYHVATKFFWLFTAFSALTFSTRWFYRNYFEMLCENVIRLNIEQYFFFKLYNMPFVWHLNNSTGYNASAVKKISRGVADFLFCIFHSIIPYATTLFLFFIYSFNLSGYLLLYMIIILVILLVYIWKSYQYRLKYLQVSIKQGANFDKTYFDLLSNIKTLKKLYVKNFPEETLIEEQSTLLNKIEKVIKLNAFQRFVLEFLLYLIFVVPIGYYFFLTLNGQDSLGIIVIFVSMQSIFTRFLTYYMKLYRRIAQNKADLDLLKTVFEEKTDKFGDKNIKKFNNITFENTYYSYKSDDRLFEHKVDNLEINSGEKIGIIGTSGAGKTTFLNLLSRNIIPKTGKILINKTDYTDVSEKFFEDNFVYISQEVELLDMSFKDNILLGKKVSDKKFKQIVKMADLEELLYDRLGGNENEILGERGTKVSAGEKQRINIARAFAMDKKIIILDEITANLDRKTSANIRENLRRIFEDKTVIAISHEINFMKYMDRTIVFEDGKIIKQH